MVKFVNLAEIDNSIQQANMNDLKIQDALYGQQVNRLNMEKQRRADADADNVRRLTREAGGDMNTLRNRLYQEGYLDQGQALDKQIGETAKSGAELQKTELGNAKERLQLLGSAWGAIRNAPEQAEPILMQLIQNGVIPEDQGRVLLERMPQDMEERRRGATSLFASTLEASKQLEEFSTVNAGGRQVTQGVDPVTGNVREVGSLDVTMTPYQIEQNRISQGNLAVNQGNLALGRDKLAFDKSKPVAGSASQVKLEQDNQKRVSEAQEVLTLLNEAETIIDQATGSYLGAAYDMGAQAFGSSTKGAQATAKLKAIQGALVSKMPKMTGPQSDKDVLLYREMAGQIGDPTIPNETRQAAMDVIRTLNEKYAGVAPGSSKPKGASGSWSIEEVK